MSLASKALSDRSLAAKASSLLGAVAFAWLAGGKTPLFLGLALLAALAGHARGVLGKAARGGARMSSSANGCGVKLA